MGKLNLIEFTSVTNDDGSRVVLVAGRVADHREPASQKEYVTFQLEVDVPTVRNGALLRKEGLLKAHEILFELARYFEQIANRTAP